MAAGARPGGSTSLPVRQVGSTSSTAISAVLVVQAAGAVVHPGLYRLALGARVADLVAKAGGPSPGAELDSVALAAKLVDGQRVYVPRVGEVPPPVAATAADGPRAPPEPVDLNTATADELDSLPGIGPATAAAIVAYRELHGPFHAIEDLLDVRGIGPAKLDALRGLVRV